MTRHTCVVDIAYGDSGKGALVDRLCAEGDVKFVVRFNGGCQAQHNVVTDDGRHHTFSQFGSGTLQGVPTYLSKYVMVEPLSLMVEADALQKVGVADPFDTLYASPDCLVTTPYHWLLNRWREDRVVKHGSCGRGVGATAEYALLGDDALRLADLPTSNRHVAKEKLSAIRDWVDAETRGELVLPGVTEVFERYEPFTCSVRVCAEEQFRGLSGYGRVVFEGAQGVLLDEDWGFHPHTTWSRCTGENAREFTREVLDGDELDEVGVVRTYTTRHGAGPFVAENPNLDIPERHNADAHYQGSWRVGDFDLPAIDYARRVAGVSSVYVTHVDSAYSEPRLRICQEYRLDGKRFDVQRFFHDDFDGRSVQTRLLERCRPVLVPPHRRTWGDTIASLLDVPLYGIGCGPRTADGIFKRQPAGV